MDNYLTPTELRAIADFTESLQPVWEALTNGPKNGISLDSEDLFPNILVYDSNGDNLGRIAWGESGPSFYPGTVTEDN